MRLLVAANVTATVIGKCVVAATAEEEVKYNKDNDPFATAVIVITSEHKMFSFRVLKIVSAGRFSLHYII